MISEKILSRQLDLAIILMMYLVLTNFSFLCDEKHVKLTDFFVLDCQTIDCICEA